MFRKLLALSIFLALGGMSAFGQETWSLERCIEHAIQHNLTIKQAQNQIRNAELTVKQNQMNRLPDLNGSVTGGAQFGRTIDPTTNSFNNQTITFNSYNLSTGVSLFSGNQLVNAVKQSKIDLEVARLDAQTSTNNTGLQIALAYLNVLLSQEQLEIVRVRREQSRQQLAQTIKLIDAGARPANERLDFEATLAIDEQAFIEAENAMKLAYLNLKQLLLLDPNLDIRIEKPDVLIPADIDPDKVPFSELYTSALGNQPEVRAADQRVASAQVGVDLAKGSLYPTLTVFGSLRSNYSDQARRIDGFSTTRVGQTVFLNGTPVDFEVEQAIPQFSKNPYFDQINENFGQSLGMTLSIPIFNNLRSRIGVQRAQLGVISAEVNTDQTRQQLRTNVEQTITAARASKRTLAAAQTSLSAAQAAFDNTQRRYDLGAANALELTNSRTNLERAKLDLARARYQHLFNIKQIEFYQGKGLRL
ncbi:MAG: TolC family protein [Lewinellaceae bacterium]|nr:TolC family protein [Lewinellaceae bacterium]